MLESVIRIVGEPKVRLSSQSISSCLILSASLPILQHILY